MTIPSDASSRKQLGKWIRDHRRVLGLSQADAAQRAGFSRTQWMRLERGEAETKRTRIEAIAKAIEADLAETYRLAGFDSNVGLSQDRRQLMSYYDALPPICRYDMLTLAQQLYENHVVLGRRAGRLSSSAMRNLFLSHSSADKPLAMDANRYLVIELPENWQTDPDFNELVAKVSRVVPEQPPQESLVHRKRA